MFSSKPALKHSELIVRFSFSKQTRFSFSLSVRTQPHMRLHPPKSCCSFQQEKINTLQINGSSKVEYTLPVSSQKQLVQNTEGRNQTHVSTVQDQHLIQAFHHICFIVFSQIRLLCNRKLPETGTKIL